MRLFSIQPKEENVLFPDARMSFFLLYRWRMQIIAGISVTTIPRMKPPAPAPAPTIIIVESQSRDDSAGSGEQFVNSVGKEVASSVSLLPKAVDDAVAEGAVDDAERVNGAVVDDAVTVGVNDAVVERDPLVAAPLIVSGVGEAVAMKTRNSL